jgi:hypothetical protein
MDIKELETNFFELQKANDDQFKSIIDLKKKLKLLEEENKSLKNNSLTMQPLSTDLGISNEEIICRTQIAILKTRALQQELTFEESKKLQIYVDVLDILSSKEKTEDESVKFEKLSNDELLQVLNGTIETEQ